LVQQQPRGGSHMARFAMCAEGFARIPKITMYAPLKSELK
jgi:hypothetical protein